MDASKELWVCFLSGPAGCGKSTFMETMATPVLRAMAYTNPDLEMKALAEKMPGCNFTEFGRRYTAQHDARIDAYVEKGQSFVIETAAPSLSHVNFANKLKRKNYLVAVIAIGVASPQLADARIQKRIANGGHDVPRIMRETYWHAGAKNTPNLFAVADEAHIYDNTGGSFIEVARKRREDHALILRMDDTILPAGSYTAALVDNTRAHGLLMPRALHAEELEFFGRPDPRYKASGLIPHAPH